MTNMPQRTRRYLGPMLDSNYWDHFTPRDDDIIISTSMKAGTTWMQRICAALVLQSAELEIPLDEYSPWVDMRISFPEVTQPRLEAQTHRRFIKSHIPLDALLFFDNVKYIVVGREGRDVMMSAYHHYLNMAPHVYSMVNSHNSEQMFAAYEQLGMDLPPTMIEGIRNLNPWEGEDLPFWEDPDIHDFIHGWLTRGLYEGELDGYPFWSHFRHLQSWWEYRHLPNIMFVHYADLLADLSGEMRRISAFLDINVNEEIWPSLVDAATFKTMKQNAEQTAPALGLWRDTSKFFRQGTNGSWQDVMTDKENALYEVAINRELDPDAIRWMVEGTKKAGDPGIS